MIKFNILGPLEVQVGVETYVPQAAKVRQLLALLLFSPSRVTSLDLIIEELWDARPPRSAVATTQTYIYLLRRFINESHPGGDTFVVTHSPGYMLNITPEQTDLAAFEQSIELGRSLLDEDRPGKASAILREGLAVWRGPALANVPQGRVVRAHAAYLEELRLQALELRISADLKLGHHHELVGELKSLVTLYPTNEWLYARLIEVLAQSGRRHEALVLCQQLYRNLDRTLGVGLPAEIRRLQAEILSEGFPAVGGER